MENKITLATLSNATAQEVFDQVAEHLLKQNQKCFTGGIGCVYKNDSGLKCAAGVLIGDDEYRPDIEGEDWETLAASGYVPRDHNKLIYELQLIHDNTQPDEWRRGLLSLSLDLGLEAKPEIFGITDKNSDIAEQNL